MERGLPAALAASLALTLVLETGFFLLAGKRNKKDLLLLVLVNALTNPAVVLLFWLSALYTRLNRVIVTGVLELLAVWAEGYYYKTRGQEFARPYLFSVAANAFSFGTGILLQQFMMKVMS